MEVSLRDITAQQSDYDKTRPCGAVQAHVDSQDQRLGQGNGGMEIVDHCPLQRRLDVAVNRVVGKGGFPRLPSNCTASEHLFIIQALSPS
jgi:hypothetical protein